jgi:hypothetical protein
VYVNFWAPARGRSRCPPACSLRRARTVTAGSLPGPSCGRIAHIVLAGQVRSGLLLGRSPRVQDHESHKAASATSQVTSLESSYARIIRDDTAEPTTNAAENHSDVLQAANLFIRARDHREAISSTAQEQEPFHKPLKQDRATSNLLKRSRY